MYFTDYKNMQKQKTVKHEGCFKHTVKIKFLLLRIRILSTHDSKANFIKSLLKWSSKLFSVTNYNN